MAVSVAPADIQKMAAKSGATFPLYADPDRNAVKAWGVHDAENDIALPATFVVDAQGKVAFRYMGESPADRPLLERVMEALRSL